MKASLGYRVRDKLTGFEGVVVSRTEWLHGCVRCGVQSEEMKDGKPMDVVVFDEPQLEILNPTQFVEAEQLEPVRERRRGGPSPAPNERASVPQR